MNNQKEKGIIEKLGITPGPWDKRSYSAGDVVNIHTINKKICSFVSREDVSLIAAAPEMLEALIDDLIKTENEGWCEVCENHEHSDNCKNIIAVQKATGKSWEEIKELL